MKHDRGNSLVHSTATVQGVRTEGTRRFSELPWPGPSDELWRRTDISNVEFESYTPQGATPVLEEGDAPGLDLNLYGGKEAAVPEESSRLLSARAAESRDKVEALHFSRLNSGFTLRIPAGTVIETPLILRLPGGSENTHQAAFGHILAEEGSSVQIFILIEDSENGTLRTAGIHCELEEGSAVNVSILQDLAPDSRFFAFHSADTGPRARLSFAEIDLGAELSVSAPVFSTRGADADIDITGLYAAARGQHKNMRPVQRHVEPRGRTNSLYKGALIPGSRTVFQGLIRVEPGAVKTDAYLSNKNLLMDDGARADSIPSLQILNNDVRCTHGSTTGKLDPEQVYYLQSRGFSRSEAERVLLWGFYEEALSKLPENAAEIIRERLKRHPLFRENRE